MGKSKLIREKEQNEEYRIVADAAPDEMEIMCGPCCDMSPRSKKQVLDSFGIHEDGFEVDKVSKAVNQLGKRKFRYMLAGLVTDRPSRNNIDIARSRAAAYGSKSVLTPQQIIITMETRPDIAAINISNGVLEMAASVREYKDMPLLSHHGEESFIDDRDKNILKSMMAYRNRVIREYTVEEPSKEDKEAWAGMFMRLMAKAYAIAGASYTGGN